MTDNIYEVKNFMKKIKYMLGIGIKTNLFMNFKKKINFMDLVTCKMLLNVIFLIKNSQTRF